MDIRAFYEKISGNYNEAFKRFSSDEVLLRFVKRFADDPSAGELQSAMAQRKAQEAFRAAHNLKGVCANLSFTKLKEAASCMTEMLRSTEKVTEEETAFLPQLISEYYRIIDAIDMVEV